MTNMVMEQELSGGVVYSFEYPEDSDYEQIETIADKAFNEAYATQQKTDLNLSIRN